MKKHTYSFDTGSSRKKITVAAEQNKKDVYKYYGNKKSDRNKQACTDAYNDGDDDDKYTKWSLHKITFT